MTHFLFCIFLQSSLLAKPLEAADTGSGRLSPTCLSERPPGCYDACVYRNHLNYFYQETVLSGETKSVRVDDAEAWHDESQNLLREILSQYKTVIGKENIALAAIQIISEEEGKLKISHGYFNFPYIHFSGSSSNLLPLTEGPVPDQIRIGHTLEGRPTQYHIKTVGDFLSKEGPASTPAENVASHLRPLLESYFDTGAQPTKFDSHKIDEWYHHMRSYTLPFGVE